MGSGDLQIGSLVAPYTGWVAANIVIHSSLRFASLEAWTHQSQGKSRHFTIVLWQKTLGFRTHSIGCLAATRGRSNWKMVSVHFFCFQLFNYRNPWHQIHCSRQGNRSQRRNRRRDVTYHAKRDEKRKETNDKRSLRRASQRASSTSDATEAVGASSQERTRCISAYEYGPPLFQRDDLVIIIKDTSPGVHFRYSYDKVGRVTNIVNNLRQVWCCYWCR